MYRILIVDDAMFMRQSLAMLVKEIGIEVAGFGENGFDAIEQYDLLKPDLVTLDITMPEMSGIEALKVIKNNHPEAKVLMVSAMGQQSIVIEAIQAGAKGFIVKPFKKESVESSINKLLSEGR